MKSFLIALLLQIRLFIKEFVPDHRARMRKEVRVAPRGSRGRIYAKRDTAPSVSVPTDLNSDAEPIVHCAIKIIRADGSVEEIVAPVNSVYFPNG
jgi:hypothetical protein